MKRSQFIITSAVAPVVLASARRPLDAQSLTPISIGTVGSLSDAPFFIAEKLGYFRDVGLAAEISEFGGAPQMIAPLGTGQLDVGSGAPTAGFYNAVARGIDVRMVADKASSPPGYGYSPLLVRADLVKSGRYKSVRDLKGMRIAEPAQGGSTGASTARLLATAGLSYDDVQHVYLSYPDQLAAFANGSIDASSINEPVATFAERKGVAVRIMGNDKWYPNQNNGVVLYGTSLLRQRREVGLKFMVAWLRAVRFYNDALINAHLRGRNAKEVIDVIVDTTPIKDRSVYPVMVSQYTDPYGRLNLNALTSDLSFYRQQLGLVKSDVTVAQAVDMDFAQQAVSQLGPYKHRA